jgi:signal-transduction protein with cAMP-binding, CBS, and nucleotidyltransferase domain
MSQVPTRSDSPVHQKDYPIQMLRRMRVREVLVYDRPYITFSQSTSAAEVVRRIGESNWQDAFPVLGSDGRVVGLIDAQQLRVLAPERDLDRLAVAFDLMSPPVLLSTSDSLYGAMETLLKSGLRELPVCDRTGRIVGFLDEAEVVKHYLLLLSGTSASAA